MRKGNREWDAILVNNPEDPEEWAKKIYKMYTNRKLRAKTIVLSRAGISKLTTKNLAKKTIKAYEKVYLQMQSEVK